LVTLGRFIGRATNNVAEYKALITALEEAKKLGAKKIVIRGDSELIIKQMRGEYRVKHPDLRVLYDEAQHLYHQFDEGRIEHNLRHKNETADKLANLAMDRRRDVMEVDESPIDAPAPAAPVAGQKIACPRCGCVIEVTKPSSIRPHQLKPFVCQCGAKMM
jgi:ribonuclease HI